MVHRNILTTWATFRNELRLLLRDPFCVALLVCFLIGLTWASRNSYRHWRSFAVQQAALQAEAREAWLSQETANAHMATHVGQTVYKPISPLAGFDPGAISDFGLNIFLQSHHQSSARKNQSLDEMALVQNEAYSPAVLLQLIGPLLIIVLGIASIAREKEGGPLSILLTTGSAWTAIALGKGLAVLLVLLIVAAPGLVLLMVPWLESGCLLNPVDLVTRQIMMVAMLLAYFLGWLGLTLFVSSKSKTMTGSFSILLALWSVFALVMPRVAGEVAALEAPLPTNFEIRLEKELAVQDSDQSSYERAKAQKALEERLLKQFKVDRLEDLPIDLAGAQMIDHEANSNRLFDEIEARVTAVRNRQDQRIRGFQWGSPYMAMRAASASLSATDRKHHFDFVHSAENYRRRFVKELNVAEMNQQKPGDSPLEQRQFWAQVTEFVPGFVSAGDSIKRALPAFLVIAIFAGVMLVAVFLSPPNISRLQ